MNVTILLTIICFIVILGVALKWFISNFSIGTMHGDEMSPAFSDGEVFLVRKTNVEIKMGNIYIFEVSGYGYLIRRLHAISTTPYNGHKSLYVIVDNQDEKGYDSWDFGYLPENSVKGKIIKLKFWRN